MITNNLSFGKTYIKTCYFGFEIHLVFLDGKDNQQIQ
jgi:hypothetical protein